MNPVHFLFPSADPHQLQDNYDACGCTGFDDENIDCNEFEEEEPKINSEIVDTGSPYKEIEIIINDNRMVLRIQRLPSPPKEEYEPPCDCLPGSTPLKPSPTPSEPPRVITAAPIPPPPPSSPPKPDKLTSPRPIDLAENPNMFLLKIRKRSETSDRKRENLDLEFRTPRPWLPKPPEKRKKSFREEYQEQKENQGITQDNGPPTKKKKSKKGKK